MAEVRIDVEEDSAKVGYALITFRDSLNYSSQPKLLVARRSLDTPYLGKDGAWQASPAAFDLDVLSGNNEKTVLRVGPDVADRIPFEMQVRLQIEGTEVFGFVFWPDIPPEPKPARVTIMTSTGSGKTEASETELPSTPAPFELQVPPVVAEPEPTPAPEPTVVAEPPVREPDPEPVRPPRKHSWFWILLLLILGAGAVALYFNKDKLAVQQEVPLAERFEQLRSTDTNGADLLQLSRDAYARNDNALGRTALDLAIERKNQAAKLELAKWYDPRSFRADRVPAANANEAARAYWELANEHENVEAATLLSGLCARSRSAAASTDSAFSEFRSGFYCEASTGQ